MTLCQDNILMVYTAELLTLVFWSAVLNFDIAVELFLSGFRGGSIISKNLPNNPSDLPHMHEILNY